MPRLTNSGKKNRPFSARKLSQIIELGETDFVEFKRRFSDFEKIAKEIIAFANTRGGLLLIGVDDDGTIVGVDSEKHEIELINTAAEFYCDPAIDVDIEVVEVEGEDVVVVTVAESDAKPHFLVTQEENGGRESGKGGRGGKPAPAATRNAYIRQNDRSVIASKEVVRVLASSRPDAPPLQLHIGKIERALFDYLEKQPRITLREFRHLVNISERRASRALVALVRAGLIRIFTDEGEDYYTLA